MANISFRSSSTATSASVNTLSVTAPSGTGIGDVVVILATRNASANADSIIDNNAGHVFTKDYHQWESTNGLSLVVFSKRIVSGDPGSYSFTFSGDTVATRFSLVALTFQNPDPSSIWDIAPSVSTWDTAAPDNNLPGCHVQSVTSSRTGCVHIICCTRENGTGAYDSTPSGYTLQVAGATLNANNTVWYKVLGAAGATGQKTVTASGGGAGQALSQSVVLMNSLAPASFTIAATSGALALSGIDTTLRVSAITYLRYRK